MINVDFYIYNYRNWSGKSEKSIYPIMYFFRNEENKNEFSLIIYIFIIFNA